jgi:DNA-binding MarR family transcriptional regulator
MDDDKKTRLFPIKLTKTEFKVLNFLRKLSAEQCAEIISCSVTFIASNLGLDRTVVFKVLKSLELKGVITKYSTKEGQLTQFSPLNHTFYVKGLKKLASLKPLPIKIQPLEEKKISQMAKEPNQETTKTESLSLPKLSDIEPQPQKEQNSEKEEKICPGFSIKPASDEIKTQLKIYSFYSSILDEFKQKIADWKLNKQITADLVNIYLLARDGILSSSFATRWNSYRLLKDLIKKVRKEIKGI